MRHVWLIICIMSFSLSIESALRRRNVAMVRQQTQPHVQHEENDWEYVAPQPKFEQIDDHAQSNPLSILTLAQSVVMSVWSITKRVVGSK